MNKGVIKKLAAMSAVLCVVFCFASCGKTMQLTLGETTIVEKHVEFTAENVLVSSQVFPPISNNNPMGWVQEDENKTYITVVASIRNLGDSALSMEMLWNNFCIVMGEELIDSSIVAVMMENGTKLSDDTSIEAGKMETVYFITSMDKADLDKELSAEFDFDGTTLMLPLDGTSPIALFETLDMEHDYKVGKLGTVTPEKLTFMDELEPSNPGYTYDYYVPKTDDDRLLVLTTETKNTSKSKKAAYRFLNMMVFSGDEEYLGDIVAEDAYSANITDKEKLDADETRKVYALVNLPKSVKKADCEIYVYIDGKYYQYKMK